MPPLPFCVSRSLLRTFVYLSMCNKQYETKQFVEPTFANPKKKKTMTSHPEFDKATTGTQVADAFADRVRGKTGV